LQDSETEVWEIMWFKTGEQDEVVGFRESAHALLVAMAQVDPEAKVTPTDNTIVQWE